jgi:hypothetical protein
MDMLISIGFSWTVLGALGGASSARATVEKGAQTNTAAEAAIRFMIGAYTHISFGWQEVD